MKSRRNRNARRSRVRGVRHFLKEIHRDPRGVTDAIEKIFPNLSATPCGAQGPGWNCARPASRRVNGEPRCAFCGPEGHDPSNEAGAEISPL